MYSFHSGVCISDPAPLRIGPADRASGWFAEWPRYVDPVWLDWRYTAVRCRGKQVFGYNIKRRTLDPILRELAARTPGVSDLPGNTIRKLVQRDGKVELETVPAGSLQSALVVGADGRNSAVAKLAGVEASSSDNCRFGAFRSYRNVPLRRGKLANIIRHI
jgi:flavin-dependent dehydrogenase